MTRRLSFLATFIAVLAIGGAVLWTLTAVPRRAREMAVAAASAAFQREVTTGRISGTPWTGLALEDVTVAAPPADGPPAGRREPAVLIVKRLTLHFDPFTLATDVWRGRGIAASISQVTLDEPTLAASRDAAGRWNVSGLFPQVPGEPQGGAFVGRVIVLNGTVTITDRHRLAPRTFEAKFEDLNGTVDFSTLPRVALRASFVEQRGDRRVPARLRGAYTTSTQALDLDVDATGADAGIWGPYLVTPPAFRITGGEFDAAMHILLTAAGGRTTTDYQGRIVVRDGRATIPGSGAAFAGVRGAITIANQSFRTDGLRGTVNGSPLELRGEASLYGEPRLDVAVRTPGVDLATLRRLLFPQARLRISGIASGDAWIVGPPRAPRVDGRIEAARGQIDHQSFDRASGDFALYGQTLRVAGARAQAAGGSLSGDAWWTIGSPEFLLDVQLDGADAAALSRWTPGPLAAVDGRVAGSITAWRRGSHLAIAGRASVTRPRIGGMALDSLDAVFRSDPTGITLDQVRARQGRTVAHLHGQISPRGTLALSAHAGAIDLGALPAVSKDVGLGGRLDFVGDLRGTLAAPMLSGDVQVAGGRLGGLIFDTAGGRLRVRPGGLTLDAFTARSGRARYWATGLVQWEPLHLALDLETERGSAATFAQVAGFPFAMTGSVDGRVHLEGSPARPSIVGTLSLQDATIAGQTVDEATAAFRSDGIRLTVEQASLRRRASVVELSGTIDRRSGFSLGVTAQGFDLRDLSLPPVDRTRLEGRVDLAGRIAGPTSAPTVAATATSSDLRINGIRFDQATGDVRWEARTLHLNPLALRLRDERFEISGQVGLAGPPTASLAATVTNGRLSTLLGLGNVRLGVPLDGTISGLATVDGPLANPAARLDLRLSDGRLGDHPLLEGHADLTLREGSVTIEEFQVRPVRGLIVAEGRFNLRGESQIEVGGSDLDLDILRPLFRLRRPLLGRLNFTTQLTGTLASPEIGFASEVTRGGIEGATFDSLVANAYYRDGLLQVQQALLVQNGNKLRASGVVPFNPALLRFDEGRPIDFRLTLADVNLGLLRLATDRVEEAVGAVEGEVRIDGTVGAPRVAGRLQIADGRMRVRGLQTPIEALRLDLRFDESTIRVVEGTARLGGGTARLEGAMRLASVARPGSVLGLTLVVPEEAPLVLTGSDLSVVVPPFIDARAAGTLRAWGTLGDPRRPPTLDGGITVSDGTVTVVSAGAGAPSQVPVVFRRIRVEAGRNLAVQVGTLRFDLQPEGAVVLTGTPRAPMLEGTLAAKQGKIQALGTLFDLREGTATFLPHQGLRPIVFAQAETQVGSTRIFLEVRGTAPDALVLSLSSDPDLPRREIVALLGQQVGISRLLAGDVEGALRAQIGRLLFGQVSLGVGRAIGLSELVIEYDFERPLALRAGRLLLNDLYWTVTTTFATRPYWVTGLEYRFAHGWQLSLRLDSDWRREAVLWYGIRF